MSSGGAGKDTVTLVRHCMTGGKNTREDLCRDDVKCQEAARRPKAHPSSSRVEPRTHVLEVVMVSTTKEANGLTTMMIDVRNGRKEGYVNKKSKGIRMKIKILIVLILIKLLTCPLYP